MAENSSNAGINHSEMQDKRLAAKQLIKQYYFQLTKGCGNENCDNEHCASSPKFKSMTPDDAAAKALELFVKKAMLCVTENTVKRTNEDTLPAVMPEVKDHTATKDSPQAPALNNVIKACHEVTRLTEESFRGIITDCRESGHYAKLVHTLGNIFASPEFLGQSFIGQKSSSDSETHRQLSKEQLRSMEVDLDKDSDSQEPSPSSPTTNCITVDISAVRRSFEALSSIELRHYESAFVNALILLSQAIELDLKNNLARPDRNLLNVFVIVFELPWLGSGEFLESALPHIARACALLPLHQQAALVRFWAAHCIANLKNLVQSMQQLISLKVITGGFGRDFVVNDDESIVACVKVLRIFFCVNVFASTTQTNKAVTADESMETDDQSNDVSSFLLGANSSTKQKKKKKGDALLAELGVSILDCRRPAVPFAEFYNEPLSEIVEMDRDFANFAAEQPTKTSFMNFPFILTPAAKALGLYYDNRIRMYSERRQVIYDRVFHGQFTEPYLKLRIRRDHVVNDALNALDMVASENPADLKKQLVVEFEGEQGIDEGGLSKEFFQLVTEEVFNPDYAMFAFNGETRNFWFNPTSFESDAQFTLIGIMLGLAIYNTVILDVHFPMVLYRKLLGRKGTFEDLQELDPTLYKGLKELLEYAEPDIEETFMQTFNISYKDVFGVVYHHDLKEDGASCCVNRDNRREFAELYADFLLNGCVERQFAAFRRGFAMVTDESPLAALFRPEEVEQLVCGSQNFNFGELQNATEYDGGFTAQSDTIKHFWSVVHEMSIEDKRRLLQFTTGSDRVPVGGLGRLKLIIARNGPDSDRLPMAHTCYNVLLLPEYGSQEKLKERLMKAIDYSKGFGML